jgi:hypothetical protein|nr:MAG TPA: Protein of unknown function (DUF739) [Caudoviricetes sp.]
MNYNLLKAKIVERGLKVEDFIDEMNENINGTFTKTVYHSRMAGKVSFRREEIVACKKILDLSDDEIMDIFFED